MIRTPVFGGQFDLLVEAGPVGLDDQRALRLDPRPRTSAGGHYRPRLRTSVRSPCPERVLRRDPDEAGRQVRPPRRRGQREEHRDRDHHHTEPAPHLGLQEPPASLSSAPGPTPPSGRTTHDLTAPPRRALTQSAPLGAWRSLVARTVQVGEVPGSNPGAPIHGSPCKRGLPPFSDRAEQTQAV